MLDVGTDRQSLLDDPLYIGNRHPRVSAAEYDAFLDAFVAAVAKRFPACAAALGGHGPANARRLLAGTATAAELQRRRAGHRRGQPGRRARRGRATGIKLAEHRIVIFGAGSAGTGIADQLTAAMVAGGLSPDAGPGQVLGRRPARPDRGRRRGAVRRSAPVRPGQRRGGGLAARRDARRHRRWPRWSAACSRPC